jgi:hypothetical protein
MSSGERKCGRAIENRAGVKRVPGWEYIVQRSEGSSAGWGLTLTKEEK